MSEQQLSEFYDRVARYEKARSKGFGHEAAGALGRSHFVPRPRRSPARLIRPVLVVLAAVLVLKSAIVFRSDPQTYEARVAAMAKSDSAIDRLGAGLMQRDAVSDAIAAGVASLLR